MEAMPTVVTSSEAKTKELAKKLWEENKKALRERPLIFALEGDLGSGKTTFVKGLAAAMGIKEVIRSPSYTLVNEYRGDQKGQSFFHLDLWRVENEKEFRGLGVERYLKPGTVIAIEWAEKAEGYLERLNAELIHLRFEHVDKNKRKIKIPNSR